MAHHQQQRVLVHDQVLLSLPAVHQEHQEQHAPLDSQKKKDHPSNQLYVLFLILVGPRTMSFYFKELFLNFFTKSLPLDGIILFVACYIIKRSKYVHETSKHFSP